MTREEKYERLDELNYILDTLNNELRKQTANTKLRIKRDRLKKEIKELKMTMTTDDFEKMLLERSEIDVDKCR